MHYILIAFFAPWLQTFRKSRFVVSPVVESKPVAGSDAVSSSATAVLQNRERTIQNDQQPITGITSLDSTATTTTYLATVSNVSSVAHISKTENSPQEQVFYT